MIEKSLAKTRGSFLVVPGDVALRFRTDSSGARSLEEHTVVHVGGRVAGSLNTAADCRSSSSRY
jgi:hypothetical protein